MQSPKKLLRLFKFTLVFEGVHCFTFTSVSNKSPQTGECVIDLAGDLKGTGTVWVYPDGVANMLSQFRMVVFSKWSMTCNADNHH